MDRQHVDPDPLEAAMNRRDAIGASLRRRRTLAGISKTSPMRSRPARRRLRAGRDGHGARQDPRHQDDPDGAQPDPPGDRQGRDDRAGPRRLGMRHVHPARAGRPDRARAIPRSRFSIGRNVDEIEDIWQSSYVSSYWRNGPVLFNAMSGVDIALWDIKAKRAGMPLYQLLGGKVRHGADCYFHASGASFTEVEDSARTAMEQGFRHVRVQVSTPGYAGLRRPRDDAVRPAARKRGGRPDESEGHLGVGARTCGLVPKLFEHLRTKLGDEVELLHDVHERVRLNEAINLCKALEPYRLYFIEDPFPPEENDHFRLLRQQTSVPIAMGELFNTQHEYVPLIKDRLIDFIRIHISQIGGLSPARKVAALGEYFGVRTAWHGPGDASPHRPRRAARAGAVDLQLRRPRGQRLPAGDPDVFVGCPEVKNGYMLAQEKPGPRNRGRREGRRQVPGHRRAAEFRLLLGHDAPAGRHGDSAVE